jgi:hypothetical protein
MTNGAWEIVGRDCQKFPFQKTVGDALRDLIVKRFKERARKYVEGRWGLDPKTARNFVSNSNVSERTLTKAAVSEGWDLWHALGVEMFGETYADHLRGVIDDYEQRRRHESARRDHIRDLENRARRVVADLDRPLA